MAKYQINQTIKTLEKLFQSNIKTEKQIKSIRWETLDQINKDFTPVEKSFIMDFRKAVVERKIIEFLAGKNIDEEGEKKND